MAMVCPQCNQIYGQESTQCPGCQTKLLYHAGTGSSDEQPLPAPEKSWLVSPWGKILVGLILAQGTCFGLQQLLSAWYKAQGTEHPPWSSIDGLIWIYVFQTIGLFAGGILAGANQERGWTQGVTLGLLNGVIFLGVFRASREFLPNWIFFSQPLAQALIAGLGSVLGCWIWKPIPTWNLFDSSASRGDCPQFTIPLYFLKGPIRPFRVLVGAGISAYGLVYTAQILDQLIRRSSGLLSMTSNEHAHATNYALMGLATVLGAAIAGANTFNGSKQGFCAGIFSGAAFVAFTCVKTNPDYFLLGIVFLTIVTLSTAGGWFGGSLVPPIIKIRRRREL